MERKKEEKEDEEGGKEKEIRSTPPDQQMATSQLNSPYSIFPTGFPNLLPSFWLNCIYLLFCSLSLHMKIKFCMEI